MFFSSSIATKSWKHLRYELYRLSCVEFIVGPVETVTSHIDPDSILFGPADQGPRLCTAHHGETVPCHYVEKVSD